MIKRFIDIFASFFGILFLSPILLTSMFLIWKEDKSSPFYIAPRVGKNEKQFNMIKLRSMVKNADKSGVDSTSSSDKRITSTGKFIRKFKLDELTQLINVLRGEMSLVGPRPNVKSETDLYTDAEKRLLKVKPGITDISSIVFSDESNILNNKEDPDLSYNQLIRPWKSRLGLVYIKKRNTILDIILILLTFLNIISRKLTLRIIVKLLNIFDTSKEIVNTASRKKMLTPYPPPGSDKIVTTRNVN